MIDTLLEFDRLFKERLTMDEDEQPHWACGKVNCDRDEQTDLAMELERERAEENHG